VDYNPIPFHRIPLIQAGRLLTSMGQAT